ncbi:MAG: hypothetical protein H7641_00190 [Candidatus Heimdallarchaeota archaeon]|nr:hypothetical protein [Candidatus Heimdallarchaeota archaeon]MCK4875982.1 hypothetical protein [Candidatus Heimdallarchaeota archaeon]
MIRKNTKDFIIPLEWRQQDSKVSIEVLEIKNSDNIRVSSLLNELCSRNVSFSIKFDNDKQYLILYNFFTKEADIERRKELVHHLKKTYSLQDLTNANSIFIPRIKKIDQEDLVLKLKLADNDTLFSFVCMLSSIDSGAQSLKKKITNFIIDLLQAEIFSIVLSHIPSYRKGGEILPKWGMMLISKSNNFNGVIKKRKQFLRYLKTNSTKLNCKLTSISKKAIARHEVNFRFYVPWIKHEGLFLDTIDIDQLLRTRKTKIEDSIKRKSNDISFNTHLQKPPKKPSLTSISLFKPLPSVKELNVEVEISDNRMTEESSTINPRKNEKIEKIPAPSTLDDLTVPLPRTVNTTFDAEYLKVRINKIFKEFDFKETVIFEDSFDLVLRKESFYIFVKFYQDILNQTNAYEIVDILSSIAGLRNDFLCIVVADVIEEGSKNVLHEFNILHLTLNDVLLNDALKAKIYSTILA